MLDQTKTLNIGFTLNSFRKGGIEKCTRDMAIALQKAGHTVFIFIFNDQEEIDHSELNNIISCNTEDEFKIKNIIHQLHKATPLDAIIHTRHSIQTPDIPKTFYIVHNVLSERLKTKGLFNRIKKTRRHRKELNNKNVICVSEAVKEDILREIKAIPRTLTTIYNGFDTTLLQQLADQPSPVQQGDYLVSVGSFNKVKRLDVLLQAFKLQTRFENLVLVGSGSCEQQITSLINELSLQNRVHLTGWLENPYPVIKAAEALVVSSDSESFSSVVAEALILGVPVVSTACKGPAEILGKRLGHYISPIGNPALLAGNINSLNKSDFDHIDDIIEKFDMKKIVRQYESLIQPPTTL